MIRFYIGLASLLFLGCGSKQASRSNDGGDTSNPQLDAQWLYLSDCMPSSTSLPLSTTIRFSALVGKDVPPQLLEQTIRFSSGSSPLTGTFAWEDQVDAGTISPLEKKLAGTFSPSGGALHADTDYILSISSTEELRWAHAISSEHLPTSSGNFSTLLSTKQTPFVGAVDVISKDTKSVTYVRITFSENMTNTSVRDAVSFARENQAPVKFSLEATGDKNRQFDLLFEDAVAVEEPLRLEIRSAAQSANGVALQPRDGASPNDATLFSVSLNGLPACVADAGCSRWQAAAALQ